jgi:hypothetical protein
MYPAPTSMALSAAMLLSYGALDQLASQTTACSLLSRAEAAEIIGKPAVATSMVITDDEQDCGYLGSGFDLHTEVLSSPAGWSAWSAELIEEGRAEAVEGIGDEAVFTTDGNGDHLIVARKGNRIVTVTMYASEGGAAEVKPRLVRLVSSAVSKVPEHQ